MRFAAVLDYKRAAQARHFAQTGGDLSLYAKLLTRKFKAAIKRRNTVK
ncbi:MAG TPA: hypothetical protein VGH42_06300 [Verrucomicrobiae bacterium]|jgi:hypothetical protein